MAKVVEIFPCERQGPVYDTYRKISNIRRTKSPNLDVSRRIVQFFSRSNEAMR